MIIKSEKGSIALFVFIALIFYTGFLLLMYASNLNKVQTISGRINFIKSVYKQNLENINDVYERELVKKDNQVPIINSLPRQIITNVTEIDNSYVIYGQTGRKEEKYNIVVIDEEFSSMTELVEYADTWLNENSQYEVEVDIKINATGNNGKTAESVQTVKLIRGVKVTNESELNSALSSTAPSYIQVANNIESTSIISVDGVTHKLDLNNNTISKTVTNESFTFITLGSSTNLTIIDSSSEKQGTIVARLSETTNSGSEDDRLNTIYTINNQGTLNIESGTIASDLVQTMGEVKVNLHVKSLAKTINNSGTINLNGGNITSKAVTQGVSYLATRNGEATATGIENTGIVNLNSGNITCYAEANMVKMVAVWGETRAYAYGVTNSGGTVNKNENVTISVTAIANEDGSYTETEDSAEIQEN